MLRTLLCLIGFHDKVSIPDGPRVVLMCAACTWERTLTPGPTPVTGIVPEILPEDPTPVEPTQLDPPRRRRVIDHRHFYAIRVDGSGNEILIAFHRMAKLTRWVDNHPTHRRHLTSRQAAEKYSKLEIAVKSKEEHPHTR